MDLMQFCWWHFQQRAGGAVGMGGGVGVVGGIVEERACHLLCCLRMFRHCYCGGRWSVGVQLRCGVLARMEGDLSHRVDLGVAWRGEGDG